MSGLSRALSESGCSKDTVASFLATVLTSEVGGMLPCMTWKFQNLCDMQTGSLHSDLLIGHPRSHFRIRGAVLPSIPSPTAGPLCTAHSLAPCLQYHESMDKKWQFAHPALHARYAEALDAGGQRERVLGRMWRAYSRPPQLTRHVTQLPPQEHKSRGLLTPKQRIISSLQSRLG